MLRHFCNITFFCIFLFFSLTYTSCGVYQSTDVTNDHDESQMPTEPGKCFAKVLIYSSGITGYELFPVYTGINPEKNPLVRQRKIIVQEGKNKWVKKKAERNCLSQNPDDCLVWCLVSQDEISETYYLVTDTSRTLEYEMKAIYYQDKSQGSSRTEWREVICEKDLNSGLFIEIGQVLVEKGFLDEDADFTVFEANMKAALFEYQKENHLDLGHLTMETMIHMGIYE